MMHDRAPKRGVENLTVGDKLIASLIMLSAPADPAGEVLKSLNISREAANFLVT